MKTVTKCFNSQKRLTVLTVVICPCGALEFCAKCCPDDCNDDTDEIELID